MARTAIEITQIKPQESILVATQAADPTNGMMFINDGSTVLVVRNTGGDTRTVTIVAVPDEAGRAVNYVATVGDGETKAFGVFRQAWWNQSGVDEGKVYVNFSADSDANLVVQCINYY
jgi:hypothetical protein